MLASPLPVKDCADSDHEHTEQKPHYHQKQHRGLHLSSREVCDNRRCQGNLDHDLTQNMEIILRKKSDVSQNISKKNDSHKTACMNQYLSHNLFLLFLFSSLFLFFLCTSFFIIAFKLTQASTWRITYNIPFFTAKNPASGIFCF